MYRLSDTDIRLLHVYRTVVECRGFSNAQAMLNVGQPTISNQIGQLERRLGVRLCERGRSGFRVTEEGRRVYDETLKLLRAHEAFRHATSELRGRLAGLLQIGLCDNVITDPACPIVAALNAFNARDHDVAIRLEILAPGDMERFVLDGSLDLAIGTFHHRLAGLNYEHLYWENNFLLCGRTHPLFGTTSRSEIRSKVTDARKVARGYLDGADLSSLGRGLHPDAVVHNLEAVAILILGGGHIGFLPKHYAQSWIKAKRMNVIAPSEYTYASEFSFVTRAKRRNSRILDTFITVLNSETNSADSKS